ncbi:hypothetical protein ABT294_09825 [Nonomuraea sp. NPDC000554]|uniref:hypothetical protein n=1 Tax=Nonomuraea sp. NPDC000554 TaxID=3154259 RepID=UPI00332053DC
MGFSGWVRCRCHEEKLSVPAPVPVRIDDQDEIVAVHEGDRARLRNWQRDACPHPDMAIAELSCANWELWQITAAVESFGDAFPVLLENVPRWHGSWWLTPEEARRALAELEDLAERLGPIAVDRLVVPGRALPYYWYHQTRRGNERASLYACPPARAGLTGRGTFGVWDGDDTDPRFEAAHVAQRQEGGGWALIDRETGARHTLDSPVLIEDDPPEEFDVVTLELLAQEWYPAFPQVHDLFRASVATGHHVHWG